MFGSSAPCSSTLADRVDELGGRVRIAIDAGLRETIADRAEGRAELADTPGPPLRREELLGMMAGAGGH